jgi:Ca2+-binding RTX toxin-like protein
MNTILNSALTLTYNQLSDFSGLDNFWQVFDTAFGTQYNRSGAEILRLQWLSGDFSQLPQIEILDSNILGNANGAYASSNNKIYLSANFVATATPETLVGTLLEEIGHFVDAHVNLSDSAGDEGAIFAELVKGESLDDATLQALQTENDYATITINGQTIQVEQQNFTGTSGNDTITGTSEDDVIQALGGNDTLSGQGGNDQLFGGTGSDTLTGGTGQDQFVFEYFNGSNISQDLDVVTDFVQGQDKIDLRSVGIADYQTLLYLISDDSLSNAVIAARYNNSSNPIYGYRLRINGFSSSQLAASDFIFSTSMVNDTITRTGLNINDLFGGLGNDTLQGSGGNDRLFGEQGDDRFLGGTGSDTFYGGTGLDTFVFEYFNGSTISQDLDVVTDFVQGQDKIDLRSVGIADYQTLSYLISNNSLSNAVIVARYNNFSSSIYGYRLRINGFSSSQLAATDFIFSTLVVNDTITGTNNSDDLFGGLGNDTLQGSGGDDRLFGEQGDDRFLGGTGFDTFYGGTGQDQFIFEYFNGSTISQDLDVVTDFVQGQDKIDLRSVGIADYQTLSYLISNNSQGNAVIAARYNNSSNLIYGYRLQINGFSSSQLAASDFIFNTSVVNDNFTGTNNSDDLFGGLGNDTLQGSGGNDRLFGEQGDDRLVGGVGNDIVYGAEGSDTSVYSGTLAQYQITDNAGVFTITDSVSNRDGIDTLYSVEKLQFSDQIITIGTSYTPIESAGNTSLIKDTANKYYAQTGNATPIAIKNGGQQISENIYPGWQTLGTENVNGQNQVLWKNIAGNYLHLWKLDSNWNLVSSEGQFALNSADAFTQETNFGIDANGDGVIGNPYAPIESAGNTKLVKDPTNKYFTQIGTNTPTAIKNGGQQIYQDIYTGWQTLAAETVNGDNQVLWKNVSGNFLHIWHLDNNWNWVSSEGQYALNLADAFTQETNFGIDANGDGVIGNPYTAIESAGNTKLVKDTASKFFAQAGTNAATAIKNSGQQIYQNIYAGWQTLAAETVNGDNQVLWKNVSGNFLHIWHLDNNWNWVSSEGQFALNSADAFTQETNFGIDANADGIIGNPYTSIESTGNTKLVKDTANKYFAQVGTATPIAIQNSGVQIFPDIYPGWQTLAVETVNGDNQVLWKNTAGNYLHIWHLDNSWNRVSSEGQFALNSADAFTQETNFGIDGNGDGIIGNPYIAIV